MLFEDLTAGMIRAGLAQARRQAVLDKQQDREELEAYYAGGREISSKLIRHPAEDHAEFAQRKARLLYPNYVARLADALIDGVYGDPVTRSIADATDEQLETLQDIWEWNLMPRVQRDIGYGIVVLGDAWVNCTYHERDRIIGVHAVHPDNIAYTTDPDNPNRVIELVETRAEEHIVGSGKEVQTHWVWTLDEFGHFDDDGRPMDDGPWPAPNPYGWIPYVHFRGRPMLGVSDGLSYIRDQITIQRALMNRLSDEDVLCVEQIHGTLVLKGYQRANVDHGPRRAITVSPDGDAFYINPNAAIKDLEESIDRLVKMLFETGSVPMSLVSGGTASSGLQLAIEMRPFTRVVESIRAECTASEKDLIRTVCVIGAVHGLGLPEECNPVVEFSDNVLPSDRDGEFQRDLLMYQNGLMLRTDFLARWIDKLGDDQAAIEEYEQQLESEKTQRDYASGSRYSGLDSKFGGGGGDLLQPPYVPPDSGGGQHGDPKNPIDQGPYG